jgi:hypothetical protein
MEVREPSPDIHVHRFSNRRRQQILQGDAIVGRIRTGARPVLLRAGLEGRAQRERHHPEKERARSKPLKAIHVVPKSGGARIPVLAIGQNNRFIRDIGPRLEGFEMWAKFRGKFEKD